MNAAIGQLAYGKLYNIEGNEHNFAQDKMATHSISSSEFDFEPPSPKNIFSRTCSVVANEIKPKEKYKKIVGELSQLQSLNAIDDYSSDNMALALEYCNVDTLEEALRLDLRIIPPGPVFYTWAAIHKTSIFDTKNNPKQFQSLNYVAKIKENADRLAQKTIPVIVVFSECEMPLDQVSRMKESFTDNQNVVVLSAERDLKKHFEQSKNFLNVKMLGVF